jgi:hypothetical protein
VRLIGYCTEGSLFLVYEFIENGNLSQHLRGTGNVLPLKVLAVPFLLLPSQNTGYPFSVASVKLISGAHLYRL